MSGRKQHFIPQSLLRGFGRKEKGGKAQVVVYTRNRGVFIAATDGIGAERNFYSELALEDGQETLDDKITAHETPLAQVLATLRSLDDGQTADAREAAGLVTHLIIRNDHFRKAAASAATGMFGRFSDQLDQEHQAKIIFGLAGDEPSPRFRKALDDSWREHGDMFRSLGFTQEQFTYFAFTTMQANFSTIFAEMRGPMAAMFGNMLEEIPAVAAKAQRRSLEETLMPPLRVEMIQQLTWRVHHSANLILPDCVAVVVQESGKRLPLMFAQDSNVVAVYMPLSSDRLLLGSKAFGFECENLNEDFASCSWDFFVAAERLQELDELRAVLRTRVIEFLEETIEEAVSEAVDPERVRVCPY